MTDDAPVLDGVHHLKLPVSDLGRSRAWYESRLGYRVTTEFTEHGEVMGLAMTHPSGGPMLALRLDPERAAAAAGFDYFSIGVPTKEAIEALAERLTGFGDSHAGVHFATIGWILPETHDPDGHEIRFYTTQHHTGVEDPEIRRVDDAEATAARRERAGP
ncbi:VOC family protein [Amycolatopsis acidicola]|uniref:VOC family protein n=1 Tax=Amycolatopsis acidicola TaxID=2596893 RepID=A0A5N0VGS9_9PSEU|nr:VOC family protein [Amycolatopsis acidicola]KAA9165549.1 VOC family protein [Amycolatopsis acidicola]